MTALEADVAGIMLVMGVCLLFAWTVASLLDYYLKDRKDEP